MKKILVVYGTRPEAIKMIPVLLALRARPENFDTRLCVTAQHREMMDQVNTFFGVYADYDLDIMKPGQNLYTLTADIVTLMKAVLEDFNPDFVLVHGDTTTSFAAALAAFYNQSKVGHVEAGLRTHNKLSPFPEEVNRQLTGRIADLHFAPTLTSERNLIAEGIDPDSIYVTGNTVIDALHLALEKVEDYKDVQMDMVRQLVKDNKRVILVTGHRRENFGQGMINLCRAIKKIAEDPEVEVIYPVHLNPNVQKPVFELLADCKNVHLVEPLAYPAFCWLMNRSYFIISDSGGVQEEAPGLGKPVLVTRDTTERPEAVEAGTVALVGTNESTIVSAARKLLTDARYYEGMANAKNPFGDGTASAKIVEALLRR